MPHDVHHGRRFGLLSLLSTYCLPHNNRRRKRVARLVIFKKKRNMAILIYTRNRAVHRKESVMSYEVSA